MLKWLGYSSSLFLGLASAQASTSRLLLCGGAQVTAMQVIQSGVDPALREDWHWRPEESRGLPPAMMRKFITTDDCKPSADGKEILISSSGGAVALVAYPSGDTLFYANVANAHTAELLPDGLLAVAASDDPVGQGDRVLVYSIRHSNQILSTLPLKAAHGLVWDIQRGRLWALGGEELLRLTLNSGQGAELHVDKRVPLPSPIGHDLQLLPDGKSLLISNTREVFLVDTETLSFTPYPLLLHHKGVKSVSIDPGSWRVAFTQADAGVWWTYTLRFGNPGATATLPWLIYKVRWFNPVESLTAAAASESKSQAAGTQP